MVYITNYTAATEQMSHRFGKILAGHFREMAGAGPGGTMEGCNWVRGFAFALCLDFLCTNFRNTCRRGFANEDAPRISLRPARSCDVGPCRVFGGVRYSALL